MEYFVTATRPNSATFNLWVTTLSLQHGVPLADNNSSIDGVQVRISKLKRY